MKSRHLKPALSLASALSLLMLAGCAPPQAAAFTPERTRASSDQINVFVVQEVFDSDEDAFGASLAAFDFYLDTWVAVRAGDEEVDALRPYLHDEVADAMIADAERSLSESPDRSAAISIRSARLIAYKDSPDGAHVSMDTCLDIDGLETMFHVQLRSSPTESRRLVLAAALERDEFATSCSL